MRHKPYFISIIEIQYKKWKGSQCLFEEIDKKYSDAEIVIALSELPDFIKSECFQPSDHYNGSYECGEEDEDAYAKDFARKLAAQVILPSSIQKYIYVGKIMLT